MTAAPWVSPLERRRAALAVLHDEVLHDMYQPEARAKTWAAAMDDVRAVRVQLLALARSPMWRRMDRGQRRQLLAVLATVRDLSRSLGD